MLGAARWKKWGQYIRKDLTGDLSGAASVAFVAGPQAMAYALIAGLPAQYGVYAAIVPVIVTSLLGSSRYSVAGPTNSVAMILASVLAQLAVGGVLLSSLPLEERLPYVFGLALLTGLIQTCMGLARLGELVHYISLSVLVGFTTGAAVLIFTGQLKNALGFAGSFPGGFFPQMIEVVRQLPQTHLPSLAMALFSFFCCLILHRFTPRLPAPLLGLIFGCLVSAVFDLRSAGLYFLEPMPQAFPPLSFPPAFDLGVINDLFWAALAIAIMGAVEGLTSGKQLAEPDGETFDGNRQLLAQGAGNMAAAFFSAMPGGGSLSRSALNRDAGAKTRLSGVFSGFMMAILILPLAPFVGEIPVSVQAGVLFFLALMMVNRREIRFCLTTTRIDRIVMTGTFAATLLLSLQHAVVLGVLLSFTLLIYRVGHPRVLRLSPRHPLLRGYGWIGNYPRLSMYLIEGVLFFGAIRALEQRLHAEDSQTTQVALINLSRVFWMDASGAHALEHFVEQCLARKILLVLVIGNEQVLHVLKSSGLLETLQEGCIAETMAEGIEICHTLLIKLEQTEYNI